ncbi:fatty acid--CoA ligase family protein [Streptomyces sp. NPDC093261]|uniref:ANL family adenylate-forming protein n=1 Tax=Streptomyces sp. NPDC093261 TaxID=3366037 RepID=UPI00381B5065
MNHQFLDLLGSFGSSEAMIFNGSACSYVDLEGMVASWAREFDRCDVRPGQVVCLEAAYTPASCGALLALMERRAIVVPLAPLPTAKRAEFLDVAQVEKVVTLGADGSPTIAPTEVTASHPLYGRLRRAATGGLVLFSSGTSGRSKASVLDLSRVLGRYGAPRRRKPKRTLCFLTLDHIGGINTFLHTLSQGGTLITIPERTPEAVFSAIERDSVNILPTTPTFLNLVLISRAYERFSTRSLELITYGTEPMPAHTLRRLHDALPDVRLKQTYGLSELGIMPTRSRSDDSLWLELGKAGFDYKVIDDVLWIRSDMAMLGYLNAPAEFDEDGFFNTQDVVQLDGDYLRILSRKSELINVGGEKVYPGEVENVLLEMDNIAEATVCGLPSPVTGMVVKATVRLVEEEDHQQVSARVREYCRSRLEPYKVPLSVEVSTARQYSERFKKIRASR